MKNIIQEIKWAYQRVTKGYDDRIYWGFDEYFSDFIPPLKKFCQNYITLEHADLNPERKAIMIETLRLIEEHEKVEWYKQYNDEATSNLWEYFGKNIHYYWD